MREHHPQSPPPQSPRGPADHLPRGPEKVDGYPGHLVADVINYDEMIAEARKLLPVTHGEPLQGLVEWIMQLSSDREQLESSDRSQRCM